MNTTSQNLIFSTEGFANRADLAAHAEEKSAKLLRHEHPRLRLVKVHVRRETPHSSVACFAVRAIAGTAGPDLVARSRSTEPITAINAVFDKLERLATAAASARKHRQRHAGTFASGAEAPVT